VTILFVLLGAVIGVFVLQAHWLAGALIGAVLGYLLASQLQLRQELRRLKGTAPGVQIAVPPRETAPAEIPAPTIPVEAEVAEQEESATEGTAWQREPAPPAAPTVMDRAVERVREWILGGNTAVRVGVVVLFFGVAFLLKYAAEHNRLPIELRLIGAALGAIAMLVIGWRLRARRRSYALVIQGGGIGILYLTVFAALRLYHLLPGPLAMALLVAIVGLSATIAVVEDSMALAVLGTVGGFLAPFLTSTGGGNHVMLFSYFAVLNAGVIGIAWFRAWRPLNVIGFVFTFGLGAAWGARFYQPHNFATVEPFLILFFLIYLLVPILFATRQPPRLKGYLDGTLVFGVPLVAFALQLRLVHDFEFGLAWTALVAGGLYIVIATLLFRRAPRTLRALAEAMLAIGVVFLTLAIPMALSGRWTSASWALEGAGILWVGVRQQRRLARAFGTLLQLAAAAWFYRVLDDLVPGMHPPGMAVANGDFLGQMLIAFAGLFSSWILYRRRESLTEIDRVGAILFLVWGSLWWYVAGAREINLYVLRRHELYSLLSFAALSSAAFYFSSRRLQWLPAAAVAIVLWPAAWLALPVTALTLTHPLIHGGAIAWPLVFVVAYWILYRLDHDLPDPGGRATLLGVGHALLFWLLLLLTMWELAYHVDRWVAGAALWPEIASGVVPALLVLATLSGFVRARWPVREHAHHYYSVATGPVVGYLLIWALIMNLVQRGDMHPLPYVPVLNPLDIAIALVLIVGVHWCLAGKTFRGRPWGTEARRFAASVFAASIFIWLNAILIRTLHQWAHVPFDTDSIFQSVLVQSSLSVFWGLLALATMWSATKRGLRPVWIVGAALLGATVVKLFLVDLSNSGTVERIVSFIAVGILMLVVGFLSPVPPKASKEER
jgi:uncharacterized membrane protein